MRATEETSGLDNKGLRITSDRPPRNTMDLVTSRDLLRAATRTPGFGLYSSPALALPSASLLRNLTTYLHATVSRLFLSRAADRGDPRMSGAAYRAPLR
jgi:hypothetical protein